MSERRFGEGKKLDLDDLMEMETPRIRKFGRGFFRPFSFPAQFGLRRITLVSVPS